MSTINLVRGTTITYGGAIADVLSFSGPNSKNEMLTVNYIGDTSVTKMATISDAGDLSVTVGFNGGDHGGLVSAFDAKSSATMTITFSDSTSRSCAAIIETLNFVGGSGKDQLTAEIKFALSGNWS